MAKGGGSAGGPSGGRLRTSDARRRAAFLRSGLRGMNITHGLPMRPGSFAYLRGGGAASGKVTINVYPSGKAGVVDGRHRITIAREGGARTIEATVVGVGPRGGQRWRYTGPVKI